MPGKRYNFKITKGPWKGRRARIRAQQDVATAIVDVQGVSDRTPLVEIDILQAIPNRKPRRREARRARK